MNYIFIDGVAVYVFVLLIIVLVCIGLISAFYAIITDYKYQKICKILCEERKQKQIINRENIRLKLKCGELFTEEKNNVQM